MEKNSLFGVLRILPSDYDEFGGQVKKWSDPNKNYPDCSTCKHFINLRDCVGNDWGICVNSQSPRKGLLTWQSMAGFECHESK